MACYHPVPARSSDSGPWRLNPPLGEADMEIPCGKCLGCLTHRQLTWTTRADHESRLWRHNVFVTLTYDDEHLPRELNPRDLQLFIKRLRKARGLPALHEQPKPHLLAQDSRNDKGETVRSLRYLACGEYGEHTERPHYHACLFNCGFEDARPYGKYQESDTLTALWGNGAAKLTPFTPATAGYTAGYITKTGRRQYADEYGELRHPPFLRTSTKPALGKDWLEKNHTDIRNGFIIQPGGQKSPIPKYYQRILQKTATALPEPKQQNPITQGKHEQIKTQQILQDQQQKPKATTDKNTPARRQAAEKIHRQHITKKTRTDV